jgi:hypothetical protein
MQRAENADLEAAIRKERAANTELASRLVVVRAELEAARGVVAAAGELEAARASLARELLQSELVGLLPRDRSYGPKADAALQGAGPRAPKTVVTGRQSHLLAMLLAQRMDYTLDYASAVDEYLKSVRKDRKYCMSECLVWLPKSA